MPKSFLITHKRYDYDDYNGDTQVKLEEMENDDMADEDEDSNPLDEGGRSTSALRQGVINYGMRDFRSSTGLNSSLPTGFTTGEYSSPFPKKFSQTRSSLSKSNTVYYCNKVPHPVTPKKRQVVPISESFQQSSLPALKGVPVLPWITASKSRNSKDGDLQPRLPTEIIIKEESVLPVRPSALNSSFKSLVVSTSSSPLITTTDDCSQKLRGNVIQYLNKSHCQPNFMETPSSTSSSGQLQSSYQIKLISPPPGGTLYHANRKSSSKKIKDEETGMETMTPSPLQIIIAAAEQQEQADEQRMFIEGSRSEESQQQGAQNSQHEATNYPIDSYSAQDQPVNLSVKKVDLFNLTQLAEVSIAAARREMLSSSTSNASPSPTATVSNVSVMNEQYHTFPIQNQHKQIPYTPPLASDYTLTKRKTSKSNGNVGSNNENAMMVRVKNNNKMNSGISEHETNLIKTEIITKPPQSAIRNAEDHEEEITAKSKKPASVSTVSSVEKEKMRNGVTAMPSPNCPITSNNLCASTSSSPTAASGTSVLQRHVCIECGKGFSTLSNLARHRQTHRSLSDASAVKKCPHCDKVYVSMPAFSMHLRTHNQGCKCPYCGKGFSRPWLLQGHIRTHTGEKPFKCGICSKAFADKSNLRAHTQTHSTEKPFACQRCGKLFALKSYLCKHIESSCMKSNRASGLSASGRGSSNVTTTLKKHAQQRAINNSSSASPVSSCASGGTSPPPVSTTSPTNHDIRSSGGGNATTVTACYTITSSLVLNKNRNIMPPVVTTSSRAAETAHVSTSGFSNHTASKKESSKSVIKVNSSNSERSLNSARSNHVRRQPRQ